MIRVLWVLTILLALAEIGEGGRDLWCYDCNTNLTEGHKGECNDPYSSLDLVACPENESHHCLKSVVLYRNVLVTVRACVPSRKIDGYCQHEESFPQSTIECFFCKDYACNDQEAVRSNLIYNTGAIAITLLLSNYLTSG